MPASAGSCGTPRGSGASRQRHALDRDHGSVARVYRLARARCARQRVPDARLDFTFTRHGPGSRRGRGQLQVRDDQRLLELRPARQQLPGRRHEDRVPVEDKLVLAADQVAVRQRRPGLQGPSPHEFKAHVVLAPLVRRGVRHHEQRGARVPRHRDRAAVLPQVLADRDSDIHGLACVSGRQPEYRARVPRHEVPELIEHAVVRQVMLGRGDDDPPAVQHRRRVKRRPGGQPRPRREPGPPVQVPDDHGDPAEPLDVQPLGHPAHGRDRGLDERRAQREVLHGVPGQRHLGENHDPRPARGRAPRPLDDDLGVPLQVPDGSVHLRKPNPQHNHMPSLGPPRPVPAPLPPRSPRARGRPGRQHFG